MLNDLTKLLKKHAFSISQKGDGNAHFLFVKGKVGSAEVSIHNNEIWLEFWDSIDEEENGGPIKEVTCGSVDEAYKILLSWLK